MRRLPLWLIVVHTLACSAPTTELGDAGVDASADGSARDAATDTHVTTIDVGARDSGAPPDTAFADDSGQPRDASLDEGASDAASVDDAAIPEDAFSADDAAMDRDAFTPDAFTPDSFVCLCTVDADCDDGQLCNGVERCSACACVAGTARMRGTACNDGDACTLDDACDGAGMCTATNRGLTDCGGVCVDLDSDATHCGACATPCMGAASCAGGTCRSWTPLAAAVNAAPSPLALAHALGSDGSDALVAWVGSDASVQLSRFDGAAWALDGAPIVASGAAPTVDLGFHGATPVVEWAGASGSRSIRVSELSGGVWSDAGRSAYDDPCSAISNIALALDGALPHIVSSGAGGCGIGIGYAYATGASWWETPMPPAVLHPGEITSMGSGAVDVAWDGSRALVAFFDSGARSVRYWQDLPAPGTWTRLGSSIDVAGASVFTGFDSYLLSLAVDASGQPWVAFADLVGGRMHVFVKRFDASVGDWVLVGGAAISDPAHDADQPSIAFVGGSVYVAYVEQVGGTSQVFASRWNGFGWQRLGATLNQDASVSAARPYVANVAGAAEVAFREPAGPGIAGRIYVRALR